MLLRELLRTMLLGGGLALVSVVRAAMPAMVDGEPLPSLAPMLEQVTPAVVNIATQGTVVVRSNPLFDDPFFRRFFNVPDQPRQRRTQSLGSGVIVDAARGLIMTNNHVIANADQIRVKLRDGREFEARLVGTDPDTDIAVIEIAAEKLTAIPLADSEQLRVGDFVVAIGNPFGLGQTVTSGIVSALARSGLGISGYEDFIQTDASINPGNSGGALVDLRGQLVGINNAIIASQSGGNIGINFAIPVNMARQVMAQLVEYGEVRRGFLGATMQDLTPDLAAVFGIAQREGAVLVDIVRDSPAAQAGLTAGDVVTAINGRPVHGVADMHNQMGLLRVGEDVQLDILREGKRRSVTVRMAEESGQAAAATSLRNSRLVGATFGDIPEDSTAYGRVDGVFVYEVDPGSPVWAAGLRAGDIVTSVNRQATMRLADFLAIVNRAQGQLLLQIRRGDSAAFMVIK